MPKVSIIIPVYNVEKYLPQSVASVKKQTFDDWELLLIDDGSPDNSGQLCDEFAASDTRIRSIHKVNGGVSSARNKGLEEAHGCYVMFVDADDWIDARCLDLCFATKPNADLYRFGMQSLYSEGGKPQNVIRINENLSLRDYLKLLVSRKTVLGVCGGIYSTEILSRLRILFNENYIMGEDWLFNFQFLKACSSLCIVDKPFYTYNRYNENGCTNNFSMAKDIQMLEVAHLILSDDIISSEEFSQSKADCKTTIYYQALTHALSLSEDSERLHSYTGTINKLDTSPTISEIIRSDVHWKEKVYVFLSRVGLLWNLAYKINKKRL